MTYAQFLPCFALLVCLASPAPAQDAPSFNVLYGEKAADDGQAPPTEPDGRILIAFWREDCAPCVAEQPILKDIAHGHPTLKVATVLLDKDAYAQRHFPPPREPNMEVWISGQDAETTLLQMRDIRRALPFSVFLHKDGSTCATHYGLLGTDLVDQWMKQC